MKRLLSILVLGLICASVNSATINVPADQPTIQAGIDAAVNGDTVLVAPGIYVEDIDFLGVDVVVTGEFGADSTTLQGSVRSISAEGPETELSGFTVLTGPVFIENGSEISIVHCAFHDIQTISIRVEHSNPTISRSLFYNNGSISCIGVYSGDAQIINNTFDSNNRGFFSVSSGYVVAKNNIVCNSNEYGVHGNFLELDYNNVWNNNPNYQGGAVSGMHDISDDPLFTDPSIADYSILPASPCVDSGDPDLKYDDPDGTRNDIGALPYNHHNYPTPTGVNLGLEDASHVVNHAPIFYWSFLDTSGSQAAFQIEVGSDAEMWESGESYSSDTSIVYSGDALADGVTYFFRLRLNNGSVWSDWVVRTFRMNTAPSAPTPLWPTGQIQVEWNSVNLMLENANDSEMDMLVYDFEIYSDPSLTVLVDTIYGVIEQPDTTISQTVDGLLGGMGYWWRCRSSDGYENSTWSAAESFITNSLTTIHVPTDQPTIQSGIDSASTNDTVLVADGIYTGEGNRDIDFGGKNIALASENGPEFTIIDCQGSEAEPHRVFYFHSGEEATAVVDGFTITGGYVTLDGPEYQPYWGGGALLLSTPTFRNCTFTGNYSVSWGAAVCMAHGDENVFENCAFVDAPAGSPSTICLYQCWANLNNCTIAGNSSYYCIELRSPAKESESTMGAVGVSLENCVVAFNGEPILNASLIAYAQASCTNMYGNESGDWIGLLGGQQHTNNNMSVDPLFCDTGLGDYHVWSASLMLPDNNDCGELIGALGMGCIDMVLDVGLADEELMHVRSHNPDIFWVYDDPTSLPQDSFEINVGIDSLWGVAEMWDPGIQYGSDTSLTYNGLSLIDGVTYFLRLRVHNGEVWSPWHQISFRMNSAPPVATPLQPIDDAETNNQPTLWLNNPVDADLDTLTYDFFCVIDTTYGEPDPIEGFDIPESDDSTGWQVTTLLDENKRYFWRTRSYDGYEYSDWSDLFASSFFVNGTPEAPTAPQALYPPDTGNMPVFDMLPTFLWSQSTDPDPLDTVRYKLEIATDSEFNYVNTIDSLPSPGYTLTDSLAFGTHYWWRVHAFDNTGLETQSSNAPDF